MITRFSTPPLYSQNVVHSNTCRTYMNKARHTPSFTLVLGFQPDLKQGTPDPVRSKSDRPFLMKGGRLDPSIQSKFNKYESQHDRRRPTATHNDDSRFASSIISHEADDAESLPLTQDHLTRSGEIDHHHLASASQSIQSFIAGC